MNKFIAGHLYIGCSAKIEEGWDVQDGGELPHLLKPDSQRYASYPHPQASRTDQGQMLCSWSDGGQMGGMVCMAMYNFEMEGDALPLPPPVPHASKPTSDHHGHGGHGGLKDELKKGLEKGLKRLFK